MTPEQWRDIEQHFDHALTLPRDQRHAWIDGLATDPIVADEVRALIDAHDTHHPLIDAPIHDRLPKGLRVGPYAVDELIGTGGMSAVYLGHRVDGQFDKRVAIKLVTGLAEAIDDQRSRGERQILAGLEHPGIARLIDSGLNEFGQPYLVMEHVEGQTLDVWRAAGSPRTRQACLDVWLKLADAVAYAHRHLVVHRDLKPSNILITAAGDAKLLDFGIAKLLEAGASGTATHTMTPLYASPEQISGKPVTTATDIYSMGVILCELVAGVHPHQRTGRSAHDTATAILSEAPAIPASIPADLAAIIGMALRKDPQRRYLTIDQFADDVRRYRRGLPVAARPDSLGYRVARFVQRNRVATAVTALLLITAAAGVATTLWQSRRAQRRFDEVRALARYLVFDFHDAVQKLPGSTELQKNVVEQSLGYLDRLAQEAGDDSGLTLELAEGYLRLGDVLGNPFMPNLGNTAKAVESYDKGLALGDQIYRRDPANLRAKRVVADLKQQRGSSSGFHGTAAEGIRELKDALGMRRELAALAPQDAAEQLKLARVLSALGTRLGQSGGSQIETSESAALHKESLSVVNAALATSPGHAGLLRQKVQSLAAIGLSTATTNPAEAIARFKDALAAVEELPHADRDALNMRRQRASILMQLGWSHGQSRAFTEGMAEYDEAAGILESIAAGDPANMAAQYHLTSAYRGRGIVCEYAGDLPCAIGNFERAAAIHKALSEKDPSSVVYPTWRGEALARTGRLYLQLKRIPEARAASSEGILMLTGVADRPAASAAQLSEACKALAMAPIDELRDLKRASGYCAKAVEASQHKDSYSLQIHAEVLGQLGDKAGAVAAIREALALLPEPKPGEPGSRRRDELIASLARYQK